MADFREVMREFEQMPWRIETVLNAAMQRATRRVEGEARKNAPKSPTQAELDAERTAKFGKAHTRKVQARRKVDRKGKSKSRNPNASSRPQPGGLVQSIQSEVIRKPGEMTGSVFVSENSKAKKYARRIHDEKGTKWNERGVGTVAKGTRADDKFIERALADSEEKISDIIESEISKALGKT